MATAFEVRELLEDGPALPGQLAEWLQMELPRSHPDEARQKRPVCNTKQSPGRGGGKVRL